MTFITIQIQDDSFQSTSLRIKTSLHMQAFRVSTTRHKANMPSGKNKVSSSAGQQIIFINTENQIKKKKETQQKDLLFTFIN